MHDDELYNKGIYLMNVKKFLEIQLEQVNELIALLPEVEKGVVAMWPAYGNPTMSREDYEESHVQSQDSSSPEGLADK